jgi:hypothetical protein
MHAEAIRAYADGYEIEFRPKPSGYGSTTDWYLCHLPDFHPNFEYRKKEDYEHTARPKRP